MFDCGIRKVEELHARCPQSQSQICVFQHRSKIFVVAPHSVIEGFGKRTVGINISKKRMSREHKAGSEPVIGCYPQLPGPLGRQCGLARVRGVDGAQHDAVLVGLMRLNVPRQQVGRAQDVIVQ